MCNIITKEQFENIRESIIKLFGMYPELKSEFRRYGFIKLYAKQGLVSVPNYDIPSIFLNFMVVKFRDERFANLNTSFKDVFLEDLDYAANVVSHFLEAKSLVKDFTNYFGVEDTGVVTIRSILCSSDGIDDIVSYLTHRKDVVYFGRYFVSEGKVAITLFSGDELESCFGGFGNGVVVVDELVSLPYEIASVIGYMSYDYDNSGEYYNINVTVDLEPGSYCLNTCFPLFTGTGDWSEVRHLSKGFAEFLWRRICSVDFVDAECGSPYELGHLFKLAMVDGEPVLMWKRGEDGIVSGKLDRDDYGITEKLLKEFTMPLKYVYLLKSPYAEDFTSYVTKPCDDGESILTIF